MKRKGLGIGKGQGYKNMIPQYDSYVHSLSAKGIKTILKVPQVIKKKDYWINIQESSEAEPIGIIVDVFDKEDELLDTYPIWYDDFDNNKKKTLKFAEKLLKKDKWLDAKGKTLKAMGGSEPLEVIRKGNKRAEIYVDEDPESPREWDNVGHMVAFHKRYELGDKTDLNSDMFNSWGDLQKYLFETKKAVVVLPLYLYDHSGLRMKVGDFKGLLPQGHYEFDSGQVGFIYTTKEDIKNMLGVNKVTDKVRKRAEKILKGEVETYDQYLIGDVYGYRTFEEKPVTVTKKYGDGTKKIVKTKEDEEIDSVWGFFGRKTAIAEAKDSMR